jgi:hypothetical protein
MGDYLVVLLLIQRKLVLFYKITQGQCPEYLTDLMPPFVSESVSADIQYFAVSTMVYFLSNRVEIHFVFYP